MSATVRFIYMIKWLFGEQNLQSIEVLFARDWQIESGWRKEKTDFRTTWLSGWFLKRLEEMCLLHER